jgi:hypothetical protein
MQGHQHKRLLCRPLSHNIRLAVLPVVAMQTEKFYDMLGSASFLTLSIGSLLASKTQHPRKVRRLR